MESDSICKSCQNPISPTYFFCPYCGRKLRPLPLSISIMKQTGLYLAAIFFPYFIIMPGITYLRQSDYKAKAVGIVIILICAISLMVELYLGVVLYRQASQLFNSYLEV